MLGLRNRTLLVLILSKYRYLEKNYTPKNVHVIQCTATKRPGKESDLYVNLQSNKLHRMRSSLCQIGLLIFSLILCVISVTDYLWQLATPLWKILEIRERKSLHAKRKRLIRTCTFSSIQVSADSVFLFWILQFSQASSIGNTKRVKILFWIIWGFYLESTLQPSQQSCPT